MNLKKNLKNQTNLILASCFIILFTMLSFCVVNVSFANSSRNISARRVLEESLLSLRQTTKEIEDRNLWLKRNIKDTRKNIIAFEKKLESLRRQKIFLTQRNESAVEDNDVNQSHLSLMKTGVSRIQNEINELSWVESDLQNRLNSKQNTRGEVKRAIVAANRDILEIENKISFYERKIKSGEIYSEKQKIIDSIKRRSKSLQYKEKQLSKLNHQYEKPISEIDELSFQNKDLMSRLKMLNREYHTTVQNKGNLYDELEYLRKHHKEKILELNKEIKSLRSRGEKYTKILAKAKKKLKGNTIDLGGFKTKKNYLAQNLTTVIRQNKELKQQITLLEKQVSDKN